MFEARGSTRMPGLPDSVSGRDGYVQMHSYMLDDLNVERVEVDDLRVLGERRVATFLRFVVRAGDGTIDQHCLDLHDFREDGALIRQTVWLDQAEGVRELGL